MNERYRREVLYRFNRNRRVSNIFLASLNLTGFVVIALFIWIINNPQKVDGVPTYTIAQVEGLPVCPADNIARKGRVIPGGIVALITDYSQKGTPTQQLAQEEVFLSDGRAPCKFAQPDTSLIPSTQDVIVTISKPYQDEQVEDMLTGEVSYTLYPNVTYVVNGK